MREPFGEVRAISAADAPDALPMVAPSACVGLHPRLQPA